MIRRRRERPDTCATLAFPKRTGPSDVARAAKRRDDDAAHVAQIRGQVVIRERWTCRAYLDGHRFDFCTKDGTDLHEGKARGMGGKNKRTAVSRRNSVLLCHGCHMKKHGVGAWLRIVVINADLPGAAGVRFAVRQRSRARAQEAA